MASTAVASNTIVVEVLDQHNYEDWSSRVKTYLSAKDLWQVVTAEPPAEPKDGEPDDDEYKAWMKKNAKALHAIKVSCGTEMFFIIRESPTAKIAWDDLQQAYDSRKLRSEFKEEQEMETRDDGEESGIEAGEKNNADYNSSCYEPFFAFVGVGDWENAKEYLGTTLHDDPNALRERHPKFGYTALQFAAKKGRLDIVRKLVPLMRQEDMEIPDNDGYTALHEAVDKQHLEIVKELLLKMRPQALGITNTKGATALHTAAKLGNVEIVKELVTTMQKQDLEIKNDKGYTALGYALVARNVGADKCSEENIIKMAEYMVNKNQEILTISFPPYNLIPVVEACKEFKWDVVRYLCSVTPLEALMPPRNASQGATLICCCLEQKKFDIARDLLALRPSLATVADLRGDGDNSPILVLSRMRPVFLRGMQLRFWQKWIYNCISRPADSNNLPGVPSKVSNSEDDQAALSIQPPADYNLDDVSIIVSNSEVHQGSQEHLLSSVISLPPPTDSEVNQGGHGHLRPVRLFRRLVNGLLELSGINHIYEMKSTHDRIIECTSCIGKATDAEELDFDMVKKSIFEAVKQGDVDFVAHMGNENRQLIDVNDEEGKTIFHMAIECRQEEIYNLIYGLSEERRKEFGCSLTRYENDTSLLHSAGTLSPLSSFNHIQGASLQMQRELQWFKEVESVVPQGMHECRNTTDKLTARELFHNNHGKLMEEAEKSMKGTAASCTVVGSLIITMMFAAAFTVPGGTDGNTGLPVFVDKGFFMVYIIADTVSLVASTTSVLIFLGILTSRYAEDDFLKNLPTKMMIGLFTLFVSIVTMMTAFYCGLVLMLRGEHSWVVIPSIVVASIPVISFAWMLFPLLVQTFRSTYGRGIFRRKVEFQRWSESAKV